MHERPQRGMPWHILTAQVLEAFRLTVSEDRLGVALNKSGDTVIVE